MRSYKLFAFTTCGTTHGSKSRQVVAAVAAAAAAAVAAAAVDDDDDDVDDSLYSTVFLFQNTPPGHVVVHVSATDRDGLDSNKLRYYVMEGDAEEEFTLDESSGILSVKTIPDREKTPSYSLKVSEGREYSQEGRLLISIARLFPPRARSADYHRYQHIGVIRSGPQYRLRIAYSIA